jgi:hypothetical protein
VTTWERFKFNLKSKYMRVKYRKYHKERQAWNRQRIDTIVKDIIIDRNPYNVWGIVIPADYLTEWELRYVLNTDEHENFKRWFDGKIHKIIEDLNSER